MATRARDVMTPDPACCPADMTLDEVAALMVQNDCGGIPVIDTADRLVGVVTDRDIVCRIVALGKNPAAHTALECLSKPVVTVRDDASLPEVVATMERHRIRRVPVVSAEGVCVGIVAQADVARAGPAPEVAGLVREISRRGGDRLTHRQHVV